MSHLQIIQQFGASICDQAMQLKTTVQNSYFLRVQQMN